MRIIEKGKWKDVHVDKKFYNNSEFEGLGFFKVLTDYELVPDNATEKAPTTPIDEPRKKKAKKKKAKVHSTTPKEISSEITTQKGDGKSKGPSETVPATAGVKRKKKVQVTSVKGKKTTKGKAVERANVIDITDIDKFIVSEPCAEPPKPEKEKKRRQDGQGGPEKKKARTNKKKKTKTSSLEAAKQQNPQSLDAGGTSKKHKDVDVSKWKELFVPEPVLEALKDSGFSTPTPIQCLTLPPAIRDRLDVLGAAETGSGKTLAFGIPMIHNVLQYKETHPDGDTDDEDQPESDEDSLSGEEGTIEGEEDPMDGEDFEEEPFEEEEGVMEDESEDENEGSSEEQGTEKDDEEDVSNDCDIVRSKSSVTPEGKVEYFDLQEGELGCVAAADNVEFDWLDEDTARALGGSRASRQGDRGQPLLGLVLTPTRELAVQVKNHLQAACSHTGIKVCCIVGGMAPQKQERLLRKKPEIVVATPGRFWELLQQGEPHLNTVTKIRTLVIDEADRMVEKGHFEEMRSFLEFLHGQTTAKKKRQTLVFSATLTLVHKLPSRFMLKKKKVKQMTSEQKLASLMELIGLDSRAKVVDITRKVGTAETLVESKINCTKEEKDVYLFYFLRQYPGRTLVFTNSKDCLRRLVSVLAVLECRPLPLHADMHQRQRLRNLDRFRERPDGLLLATDVAARGLDIPDVQHVIHYQVPRTSENYVHRSGRTARASKEGLSIMLVGPEDMAPYRRIIGTLNRDEELGVFPVEADMMAAMRERVGLARRIDKEEHFTTRRRQENTWFQRAAKEMDIELDEEELLNDLGDSHAQAAAKQRLASMRRQLGELLAQPVVPRAFSGRYPTKSGRLLDLPPTGDAAAGSACAAVRKEAAAASSARGRFKLAGVGKVSSAKKGKMRHRKRKRR